MLFMILVSKILTTRISAVISEWTCCRIRTTTDSTAAKALGIYIITIKWAREVWGQRINWNNFKREFRIRILRFYLLLHVWHFKFKSIPLLGVDDGGVGWHPLATRQKVAIKINSSNLPIIFRDYILLLCQIVYWNRCKWHTKTARIRNIFFKKMF